MYLSLLNKGTINELIKVSIARSGKGQDTSNLGVKIFRRYLERETNSSTKSAARSLAVTNKQTYKRKKADEVKTSEKKRSEESHSMNQIRATFLFFFSINIARGGFHAWNALDKIHRRERGMEKRGERGERKRGSTLTMKRRWIPKRSLHRVGADRFNDRHGFACVRIRATQRHAPRDYARDTTREIPCRYRGPISGRPTTSEKTFPPESNDNLDHCIGLMMDEFMDLWIVWILIVRIMCVWVGYHLSW